MAYYLKTLTLYMTILQLFSSSVWDITIFKLKIITKIMGRSEEFQAVLLTWGRSMTYLPRYLAVSRDNK